ncbi:MAG: class I SAM-dependent methyltransferase [Beijerinckiaceae bacterium]|nr:class I SAM-dependent methyltransferase [Beijerinckiaceae bacterium]
MGNQPSDFGRAVTALLEYLSRQGYAFVTVTPSTHARVIERRGDNAAKNLRDAFGWNLPFDKDLLSPDLFASLYAAEVVRPNNALWLSNVRVASLNGHLFVHSAYPTREEDAVFFGPDTYRFSSAVLRRLRTAEPITRAADIGCGTGAAGILIARTHPKADVVLGDINERALQFAAVNAAAANIANVSIHHSDILAQLPGDFDFIVANPPYMVDAAQRAYRHGGADQGTELSLRILDAALGRLLPNGSGLIYTGAPVSDGEDIFRTGVERVFSKHRATWTYDEIDPDVFGEELDQPAYLNVERIAAVVLEFRKG